MLQSLYIRRQLGGLEKKKKRGFVTHDEVLQLETKQVQYHNVNTTRMLPLLHVCKQQSQYKFIASLYVLSLWKQIGENPTCQKL